VITRLNGKAVLLALGMALVLGACSASAVPSGASNVQGPTSAGAAPTSKSVAGASGAAAPTSAVVGSVDACKLLTQAEVEAAFGKTVLAPVASVDHGDAICSYGVDLGVLISGKPLSAAELKQQIAAGSGTALAGVGDAAYKVPFSIGFVKGTTFVIIDTGDGPAIITDAKFQALAATAAGRI
jgi:hypothetical protein